MRVGCPPSSISGPLNHLSHPRDGHSKDETLLVASFKEDDAKPYILAWHIQHQHPREYDMLLDMEEGELREVAKEMSRVGD